MINWGKLTKKDSEKIALIAKRAVNEYGGDLQNCTMDISAAHLNVKLRLDDLLTADDVNFAHDVFGIMHNLNRDTGEIENCFRPRYSV